MPPRHYIPAVMMKRTRKTVTTRSNTMSHRCCFIIISTLVTALFWSMSTRTTIFVVADLYKLLGVTRQASTQEIKRAYRKKALDTHPDKNPDLPPEQAAETFRQVVQAFEILSDPASRRRYDQTGQTNDFSQQQQGGWNQQQGWQQHFHFQNFFHHYQRRPPVKLKDKPEVKQAQSRLMHIVSWEQFQTVLMDDDGLRLERHVLLAAVNPQLEEHVMDEMVFPFPFAGMSPQQIWWEDVLQTVLVRYHNQNELTQKLGLPRGFELTQPIFLLGKKGQTVQGGEPWARIQTNNREKLGEWVWQQIMVELTFVNHHDYAVEIYWIHGRRASLKVQWLEPGDSIVHSTHLTHEWYVRDARVDTRPDSPGRWKLTDESTLIIFKVLDPHSPQTLHIPRRTCFDLSGHCLFWQAQGECLKNPRFMSEVCQLSCQLCSDEQDKINVEKAQNGTYIPPHHNSDNRNNQDENSKQQHHQKEQQEESSSSHKTPSNDHRDDEL